jgi:hypothetical protein
MAILVAGLAVAGVRWLWRPQVVTLNDGTRLTLVQVDYGRHHVMPKVKTTGPGMVCGTTTFDTTNDTLVAWILSEHSQNERPNYEVLACDRAETACVASDAGGNSRQINDRMEIMGIQLNAFPRRERKLELRIMSWGLHGQQVAKGRFVVSNPARRSFPRWAAELLPDTQSDGDLAVTLTHLAFGVRGFNGGGTGDVLNKAVRASFRTEQNGAVVTNWQPVQIETSDATGNHTVNNSWSSVRENDETLMTYQWGLWPDEPAWKLRVEMSRTSGFTTNEQWTVSNIPMQAGDQQDLWNYNGQRNRKAVAPFAETTLNGIHLKILPALVWKNQTVEGHKRGGFRLLADPEPDQFRVTLEITNDRGHRVQTMGSSINNGYYAYQLDDLGNPKTLNVTLALHKSRFVEFTVKPQKAGDADRK